ncbi:MAG: TonB-dependent receptor [Hyphomonadaceae bacterium]|nr:TonB-dependent receptor [Hyphomonadaceae bacterium]
MSRNKFWLFSAAAVAAIAANGQAQAQDTGDEIIVTATKRETALQDVPIAVTPVTAELIQNSGIKDLQDLTSVAPSLQFNVSENETSATARLRGIGTQGSNPGLESAVGIFIDGVYRARNGVGLNDLGEVAQIEVLRGPQGTLFGRNTSAGLINVRTAGPDLSDYGANGSVSYGNYNATRVDGSVNLPIVQDVLGVRLFAAVDQRDGFIDVNQQGANPQLAAGPNNQGAHEQNNRDVWTVRGQVAFAPTNNFDARVIVDYSERDETCCASKLYNPTVLNGYPTLRSNNNNVGVTATSGTPQDPFQPGLLAGQANAIAALGGYGTAANGGSGIQNVQRGGGSVGQRFGYANRLYEQQLEDWGVSAELNWDLGAVTLSSVTAYRDWKYDQAQDSDFTQADIYYRANDGNAGFGFEIFTQELRAAFALGPVDSIVGFFYSDETLTRRDNITFGSQAGEFLSSLSALYGALNDNGPTEAAFENAPLRDTYEQEGETIALFTHNIWAIDDVTDLTIGLRYTDESKDVTGRFRTGFNAQPLLAATLDQVDGAGNGTIDQRNCFNTSLPAGASVIPGTSLAAATIGARAIFCNPGLDASIDGIRRQSREDKEFSGVVSVRREFTDNVSGYASYSRGYKGGGFNLDRNFEHLLSSTATPGSGSWNTNFEAEFVDAFEIGVKNRLLDGSLVLNVAAFSNKYQNYQLNTFNGTSFQVSEVPEVYSQGVELDALWTTPVDGLSYQGGFSFAEAEYGDDSGWVVRSQNRLNPGALPVNFRLPGSRLTNAPLWTVTGAFTYEKPILNTGFLGLAYVDFRYVSSQVTGSDLEPTKIQPEYTMVNGRLAIKTPAENWSLELWGRNLTDEETQQIAFNVPLQGNARGAFLGDPRTYGVTLRFDY